MSVKYVYYKDLGKIFFLQGLFFFIACKDDIPKSNEIVIIDPKENLKKDWLDDAILDNISYFPLESTKGYPLGNLDKFIVIDTFFISTYRDINGVFFHSLSGVFIHVLHTSGKGPLEFNDVNEIAKFDNDHILINDLEKKAILKYNFRDRKMVEEFNTNATIFSMYYQDGHLIYLGNDFKNGIVQKVDNFDFENKITLIKGSKISNLITSIHPFHKLDENNLVINVSFVDTVFVYNLTNSIIKKKFVLGKGETSMNKFSFDKISSLFIQYELHKLGDIIIPWGCISKLQNYLIFPVIPQNKCIVINLKNDEAFFMDFQKNFGKLTFVETSVYPYFFKEEGKVIYSLFKVQESKPSLDVNSYNYERHYKKLLDEKNQNPVIARFELK
ncbi:MAG TPA: 6-bladed beta-propeller [Saprospiraceae bacterium]|nr:6-bladed beta-propeller [Saprospiraceae bacterium]